MMFAQYTLGEDSIVPIVKERMNTYQETRLSMSLREVRNLFSGVNGTDGLTCIFMMSKVI